MSAPRAVLAATGKPVALGRIPSTPEMRAKLLPLGPYLRRFGAQPPPLSVDYHTKAMGPLATMLGNDQAGDCVLAAALHGVSAWAAADATGTQVVPTAKEALSQYRTICGPGDNGCYIPAVLDHFRQHGLSAAGEVRKIDGYVSVNPRDELLVKIASFLFGGLHLGVYWPSQWMADARPGGILRPTNTSIIGGHAVQVVGYDAVGLQISTWGIVCTLAWESMRADRYVDECYAMIGTDWYTSTGATSAGDLIDVSKLRSDLALIASGGTPVIPTEDPTPPVPPVPPGPYPGNLTATGTVNMFGQILPVQLTGSVNAVASAPRALDYWRVMMDVAAILAAARIRDWVAVAAGVEQLLADLGVYSNVTERQALANAIEVRFATAPLGDPGPPPSDDGF